MGLSVATGKSENLFSPQRHRENPRKLGEAKKVKNQE
jgi:hypothetical protein